MTTTVLVLIGANLKRLREQRGLSMDHLAAKVGWKGDSQIRKMETGKRGTSPDGYQRLAKALGVPIADLFACPAPSRRGRSRATSLLRT